MMECPCKDCLIIPICKSKSYPEMMNCSMVFYYLYYQRPLRSTNRNVYFENRVLVVEETVHPNQWRTLGGIGAIKMRAIP